MEPIKLEVTKRTVSGKGAARRLRDGGKIPAVVYGKESEPVALEVSPAQLRDELEGDYGLNTVFSLELDGAAFPVIVAEYQIHPVSRHLLHADFKRIDLQKEIEVKVPFQVTGKAKGVTAGGTLQQGYRTLPVRALPLNVPVKLSYDVTNLGIGDTATVADVACPEGVSVTLPAKRTVVGVYSARRQAPGAEDEAAEAAPAAGGAAPAAS